MIVGGGVVLAASYEAGAYGVRTAMGTAQARRLCPHALVVPPRMSAYTRAGAAVFEVFRDCTPIVEPVSVDEAFLDVGGLRRVSGTPVDIAARLRADVRTAATAGPPSPPRCSSGATRASTCRTCPTNSSPSTPATRPRTRC